MQRGEAALQRLEDGLARSPFLVGGALSLADVALVAYTRVAHEGGFDLAPLSAGAGLDRPRRTGAEHHRTEALPCRRRADTPEP